MSRRRRLWVLAAVLGLVVVAVLLVTGASHHGPAVGEPALPAPTIEQFGVSVNRLFNDRGVTTRELDAQLGAARAAGATVGRSDALWELAEPSPHRYTWAFDDLIAGALARHGLSWLPILDYSPAWAAQAPGTLHSPPRSSVEFAAFAAAFATRYGSSGSFWRAHPELSTQPVDTYEVWNEPDNILFWPPTPDPRRYAELYAGARAAIDAVDPRARVIVGGLTAPGSFMPAVLRSLPALRGHIDGVGIHPYAGQPSGVLAFVHHARATLASLGMSDVPLYATEFGWTTKPRGALGWLPESLRPGYIEATVASLGRVDCSLAATLLYTWVTPERNPRDREDWFGISPPGGGTSADVEGFVKGVRLATAGRTSRRCPCACSPRARARRG